MKHRAPSFQPFALAAAALFALSTTAAPGGDLAHYRPLDTTPLDTLGHNRYQLEAGIDYREGEKFPLSGLEGDFWQLGRLGFEAGLGDDATVWLRGTPYQRLEVSRRTPAPNTPILTFTGNETDAAGNFTFGTKLRFKRPDDGLGWGFQFAVEMPNTPSESGLGNDETNFFGTFIAQVRAGEVDIFANAGLGIFGDPTALNSQKDKLLYGLGFSAPVWDEMRLLGEVNGRSGSSNPGTEDRSVARLALQRTEGSWLWDVGVMAGLEDADADWGLTAGVTRRWGR